MESSCIQAHQAESNSCTSSDQPPLISLSGQRQYMGSFVTSMPKPRIASAGTNNLRLPPPHADFRLPPLRCSFPSLLHPQYALVKAHCDGWILDVGQPSSADARRLLLDCLLPRMLCRNIPTAPSLLRLIHVTKMISWLMISDDEDDLPDVLGADDVAAQQRAALVMAILHSQNDATSPPMPAPTATACAGIMEAAHTYHLQFDAESKYSISNPPEPICKGTKARALRMQALAELWGEMRKDLAPNLRVRFVKGMADYLDAVKVQAAYRKAHQLPSDKQAYIEIRRQASFLLPAFSLVEYALGIELGEDVYANAEVQEFRIAALDYICLCNDLLSCKMEIAVGDYFNMPSIVYSTSSNEVEEGYCAAFQDAINRVARMTEELDAQLVRMLASIHQSPAPSLQHPSVRTYLAALGSCMSGCLAWFLESARYGNSPPTPA